MHVSQRFRSLDDIEARERQEETERVRPTVDGARKAWVDLNNPIKASRFAGQEVPERQWAVAGLIPANTVTLFAGDGDAGKSLLALQLACATVLGAPWLGRDTKQGPAVFVSCEDDVNDIHIRLAAIAAGEGWDLRDLDELTLFDRTTYRNEFLERRNSYAAAEETPFWMGFSNWVRDAGPALIVLDSLYDFFGSVNQMDMGTARLFMGNLRSLAKDSGCTILLLSHPSKSGMEGGDGTSGTVAFRNAARAMLYLTRDAEDEDLRTITPKKQNHARRGEGVKVRWEHGRFVPEAAEPAQGAIARMEMDRCVLGALQYLVGNGTRVSADTFSKAALVNIVRTLPSCRDYSQGMVAQAQERMLSAGRIVKVELGPPSKRRIYVRPAEMVYPGEKA